VSAILDCLDLGTEKPWQGQRATGTVTFPYQFGIKLRGVENGIQMGMNYNVQGKTLQVVGKRVLYRDVYTMPFHNLNFNPLQKFWRKSKSERKF